MLFVNYPKCGTCQKARKFLEEKGIVFEDRNINEQNPTAEELKVWIEKSGLPIKKFFNTSGMLYRQMELKDKLPNMSEQEMIDLLATDGMPVGAINDKDKTIVVNMLVRNEDGNRIDDLNDIPVWSMMNLHMSNDELNSAIAGGKGMSELQDNKKDQQVFAAIWDACRDMSGYVQMHFTPVQRGELFGWNWAMIPTQRLTDYRRLSHPSTDKAGAKIASIVKPDFTVGHIQSAASTF